MCICTCMHVYAHTCMHICAHDDPHDTDSISLQVFGGIEWHGKQGAFFVMVEACDTATLLPIIKKYIALGTIIMSDCWKAYNCLEEHGYWHLNVNHSKNFKDQETGAHRNTIEGSWLHAKRSLPVYDGGLDDGLSDIISLEESSEESWTGSL